MKSSPTASSPVTSTLSAASAAALGMPTSASSYARTGAGSLRRDRRRRRRSEIEQNSRLRQKRNFAYITENIMDGTLADMVASRFGPAQLEALAQQLRRYDCL